jgi:hypothetical protein
MIYITFLKILSLKKGIGTLFSIYIYIYILVNLSQF